MLNVETLIQCLAKYEVKVANRYYFNQKKARRLFPTLQTSRLQKFRMIAFQLKVNKFGR